MAAWTTFEPVDGLAIHIAATRRGLCRLLIQSSDERFVLELRAAFPSLEWWRDDSHPLLRDAAEQLRGYFRGERREFELPLDLHGTEFQQRVWRALQQIPYGERRSYRDVAREIGAPSATRAVGAANGRNHVAIIVPCHRVISSDGSLGGYSGGLPVKQMLIDLESGRSRGMSKPPG